MATVVAGYLAVAALLELGVGAGPLGPWLGVHVLLLGAGTSAVLVWSRHFSLALLHVRPGSGRAARLRLAVLNGGVVTLLVGMVLGRTPLVALGAGAAVVAVADHGASLVRMLRRATLAGPMRPVVHHYVAASAAFVVGGGIGAVMAVRLTEAGTRDAGLHAAHVVATVFGWIGLSVLGSLLMLWPAVLRVRVPDGAPRSGTRGLALTGTGLLVAVGALVTGWWVVAAVGLLAWVAGALVCLVPAARAARVRPPRSGAAVQLALGTAWLLAAAVWTAVALARGPVALERSVDALLVVVALGVVAQLLLGSLAFLLPVVLGGGPAGNRRLSGVLAPGWVPRVALLDAGVLLGAAGPRGTRAVGVVLAGVAVLAGAALVGRAVLLARHAPAGPDGPAAPVGPVGPADRTGRRAGADGRGVTDQVAVAGLLGVVVVLALVLTGTWPAPGAGPDGATGPAGPAGQAEVPAGAATTTVEVVLTEMTVTPAVVDVPAGSRLVLEVVNEGSVRHDLAVDGGPATPRLAPGDRARLDVGVLTAGTTAWCTLPGHRQAGMVLTIRVGGSDQQDPPGQAHGTGDHGTGAHAAPGGAPSPGWQPHDAVLPPLEPAPGGTVRRYELPVVETEVEVAPGVRQQVWTFGGTVPGPVLHARVGDVVEVVVTNTGELPHSIDLHASQVAPDRLMRTIEPGEDLVYRFRAEHAGAWMYHCGTAPMIQHVAMGMYGMVVVEPADPAGLPPVDRTYALVQSELTLGEDGGAPELQRLLDADADLTVFNGYADQYVHAPLEARVGERVRVWLLDAGPSAPSAFHVVGAQLDGVWAEGAWRVHPDDGQAAQVLDLQPGSGGFVELTFPEPGTYPFLTHRLADAARGATGSVVVTR